MSTGTPHAINLSWLVRLRWGAVLGQAATIALVPTWLGVELPLLALGGVVLLEATSNVAVARFMGRARAVRAGHLAAVMVLDVVLLTALLYFTGGAFNPFSFLYLVQIALAAVVLPPRLTWPLLVLSLGAYGLLFVTYVPIDLPHHHDAGGAGVDLHLPGMWVAFAVAGSFVAYFVQRVTRALAERDEELAAERAAKARGEKLASLAGLAAGAAHELSSPLSTIAVVAKELERGMERRADPEAPGDLLDLVSDARLIRQEVERCRSILQDLSGRAGESLGEPLVATDAARVIEGVLRELAPGERARVDVELPEAGPALEAPERALAQALRGLVRNALQASPPGASVSLVAAAQGAELVLTVADRGQGMPAEVLDRVGEPFFTTKEPGAGMGLGVFLARTLLDRLGGRLDYDSAPGRGTTARLHLPAATNRRIVAPRGAA